MGGELNVVFFQFGGEEVKILYGREVEAHSIGSGDATANFYTLLAKEGADRRPIFLLSGTDRGMVTA